MTTDAARRAVFDTAELLEQIVLELPLATIFTSQRVCHQFQDIVTTSSKIQEKLFFRINGQHERWTHVGDEDDDDYDPFHIVRLPPGDERTYFTTIPARLNDFFEKQPGTFLERFRLGDWIFPKPALQFAMCTMLRDRDAKVSCSRMQVADVPITEAAVWVTWQVGSAEGSAMGNIEVSTGITVDDVVEAMRIPAFQIVKEDGEPRAKDDVPDDLMTVVREMEEKYGETAELHIKEMALHGVVWPSQWEREIYLKETSGDASAQEHM